MLHIFECYELAESFFHLRWQVKGEIFGERTPDVPESARERRWRRNDSTEDSKIIVV
jgi:hypothetical protein